LGDEISLAEEWPGKFVQNVDAVHDLASRVIHFAIKIRFLIFFSTGSKHRLQYVRVMIRWTFRNFLRHRQQNIHPLESSPGPSPGP
jgi:hypothetical protein